MNRLSRRRFAAWLLGASALLAAAGGASAQTLTWGAGGAGGAGTWSTSVANWYNGSGTVPWANGDAAVFAGTAGNVSIGGAVTASQVTFGTAGYVVQGGFLNGSGGGLTVQTDADATISAPIFGAGSSNTPFTKTGAGTLVIGAGGTPVFFSSINVAAGELRYGTTLNASALYVLGNTAGAALTFGNGISTVGSLSGGGANGGVVRPAVTSGSATFNINNASDASYAGTFQTNGTTFTLQKSGSGTQTLTGHSFTSGSVVVAGGTLALGGADGAFSGLTGVTVNRGGTFRLDNSAAVNQTRLDSSVPVTLGGGTLSFVGSAASQDVHQTVGALNVQSGASAVSVTSAGTGVSQLIFSDKTVRSTGATVDFSGGGHVTLMGASNVNGILGGYATVGADWASVDASGNVAAYTGYTSTLASASDQDNLRLSTAGGSFALPKTQGRNTLDLVNTGSAAASLQIGANQTLTLTSGGLLTSGSAGFRVETGTLTSASGELIVNNQAALTVAAAISDSGGVSVALTKSGAGTLALTGTNTYTGATYLNQGTLQASADANLGAGKAVVLNGGTLQAAGSFNSTKSLQGTGGTVDTAGNNVTFDSANGSTASFTKTGAGILTLTRQNGAVTVNGGTLRLTTLVGGNSTGVTLTNGRLEAGDNGLQRVTTLGGGGSLELSPGQIGQADTLTVGYLTLLASTVVDLDLGGTSRNDLLSVSYNLTLSGAPLLFRFNNLGNIQTGTAYTLAQLPSSQLGQFSASSFGFDPASTAAGYQGAISLNGGAVSVVFSSVPEPGAAGWLCLGAVAAGGVWARRSRKPVNRPV